MPNLIDAALSEQAAPPNVIDGALAQSPNPAPSSAPPSNLIDQAIAQPTAKQPNLIDAELAKPSPAVVNPAPAVPAPVAPTVWQRIQNVFDESALAQSLGSFFDPDRMRAEWEGAGPELRKDPAFALRHAPATSPEAWKALFSFGGLKALPSLANEGVNRASAVVTDSPIAPSAALTPAEQRAHPIATAAGDVAGGMASGGNVAIIAATGGFGELGVAGKTLSRLVSAGFSISQLWDAAKSSPDIMQAIREGDVPRAQYLLAKSGLEVALAYGGAKHASTGKGAVTGRTLEGETQSIPQSEPVAQTLAQQAPDVRLVDSAATKAELNARDTVSEPRVTVKLGPTVGDVLPSDHESPGEATHVLENGKIRVFHGTTADVADVSELETDRSRDGAAGRGIYLTDNPAQASNYAGPGEEGTGGRVLAGALSADANLLDGNKTLPEPVRGAIEKQFPELDGSKSYLDILKAARASRIDTTAVQQTIADAGDYDGVRYEHQYADGPRRAIMLFANDADLLKPTVPTARIVSDDHIPVVSRTEVLNEAVLRMVDNSRELQRLGLDPEKIQGRDDVPAMLNSVADQIKANLDPRVGATITFDAQKALAKDLNLDVEDLLARRSGAAANAESAIAARALLKDSVTRTMNFARLAAMGDSDYQAKFAQALAQHQAILESVKGMAAEAGRALGSFRIQESDLPALKISDAFSKLTPEALQKAAELASKIDPSNVREVNQFVEQIKPSSTADKVFEYYRNALLSSPKTVIVKTASEAAMMGLEAAKKFVASGLSKDRFAAESWNYAQGAIDALKHTPDILRGRFTLLDAPGFEGTGSQAIKGRFGSFVRLPSNVLERGANLMYALNYFGELRAQATRAAIKEGLAGEDLYARTEYLVANPSEKMTDAAHETALHNTFQNELGKFGKSAQRAIQSDPTGIARYLFPFFRTPINLVKASGEVSPYGLLKGALTKNPDLIARGLIGSSIAAGVAALALEGHVTGGGPIDFRKKQTLESTGWQPYSLKIGDRYVSYHRFEPLGLVMGLVADAVHGAKLGDSEEVTNSKVDNAISHIERNASDLPFLFGLSSVVDALKDTSGKRIDNFIARQVASFIPAGVANVAEGIDPVVRHPDGIAQTVQSRVPGLTGNVPASLDISGQPLQRPASALGGANPFPVTTAKNDPVLSELARLGVATPQMPKTLKVGKKQIDLTANESQVLAQQERTLLVDTVRRAMSFKPWQNANDAERQKAVSTWRTGIDRSRAARLAKLRASQNP